MTRSDLPKRVYIKGPSYYYVTLDRKWVRVSRVRDGLPSLYRALAALTDSEVKQDFMPAVIARWLDSKDWTSPTTVRTMTAKAKIIADAFLEFTPEQVTTPVCAKFLKDFADRPRTHNVYRNMLSQVLKFAAVEGLREGHSPIANIKGRSIKRRQREATDAELLAIREAALGQPRNGKALAQMIDLAVLTGQRIGDLLKLRWQDVTSEGIRFEQAKTKERLLIEWSPALRTAIAACKPAGPFTGVFVLRTETGGGYKYAGIRSAWVRACERAGVKGLHIHDLRGRAGVDALLGGGIADAQALLGHRTEAMTRHYVHGKHHQKVKPSK